MKRILFTCFATLFALTTWAADFTDNSTGTTIYYNILEDGVSVEVTWGGEKNNSGTTEYVGNITIPEAVKHEDSEYAITTIGTSAFQNCSGLTAITIPSSITSIGKSAFAGCLALTSITFPESVTRIEENICGSCTSLKEITIGSQVEVYGEDSFYNCETLERFFSLNPTPPTYDGDEDEGAFYDTPTNACTLYVPIGSKEKYNSADQWKDFGTISELAEIDIVVADSENDGYATFYHGTYDITLPDGVKAYYASEVKDGEVTLTEVEGTIPAGNAVLVEGSIADYYMDATEATTTTTLDGNMLYGSDTDTETTVNNVTDGYYFYKLSTVNGENLGFYWGAEDGGKFSIAAHKAWLAVPTTEGTRALSFKKGESDTTGITSLEVENEANAVSGIYTLQGVRVADISQKGMYIVNGRKVLVK